MLKVGDFSRIAQVSIRLLRYYAEVDLFHPAYIDPQTGYRYYQAEQLRELNKILALRDLGLTLEQIKRCIRDDLTTTEIQGMLRLKKAQVEQQLTEELTRLQRIQHRLDQLSDLETQASEAVYDVVIKPLPALHFMAMRERALAFPSVPAYFQTMFEGLATQRIQLPGTITMIEHSESYPDEVFDLEIGFAMPHETHPGLVPIVIDDRYTMTPRPLPEVAQAATLVHIGPYQASIQAYHALGRWIGAHHFEFDGAIRKLYVQFPTTHDGHAVIEVQIPIRPKERVITP